MAGRPHIGIVGTGLIGKSWTMLFVSRGYPVHLFDTIPEQVDKAVVDIGSQLRSLEAAGTLKGSLKPDEQLALVKKVDSLKECVCGALYVQECVPEDLSMKKKVFGEMDLLVSGDTILASSSSAMPCSKYTEDLKNRERCLVAHPVNPPYYMPLVELVPAPWTAPEVVSRARDLMTEIGQSPVTLKKEVPGFTQPRVQYAVIMAALQLVEEGILSPEDVDKIMTHGCAYRYSFMGPFETFHLDSPGGFREFCEQQADQIHEISKETQRAIPINKPETPTMQCVISDLDRRVPLDRLAERREWRDKAIAQLAKLRTYMDSKDQ